MTGAFYEGPAGTGKTTRLISELSKMVPLLGEDQKVLALTVMHGSRLRLIDRLRQVKGLAGRFQCSTFDSFAWHLLRRWRPLARERGIYVVEVGEVDYRSTCDAAQKLLSEPVVGRWVATTYPIMIVDEAQDCKDKRLGMMQELSKHLTLLAAADAYQDLFDDGNQGVNSAVEWLRSEYQSTILEANFRTNRAALIKAARDIKAGVGLTSGGDFRVFAAYQFSMAASYLAFGLYTRASGDTVILSPVQASTAEFVAKTIERLSRPIAVSKLKKTVEPFSIRYEKNAEAISLEMERFLGLLPGEALRSGDPRLSASKPVGISSLRDWVEHQHRVRGVQQVGAAEVLRQLPIIAQQVSARRPRTLGAIPAMTIYQAKNREFDNVFVLWPFQVAGTPDKKRRLLYNAVTRARSRATIIVQRAKDYNRLIDPPFSMLP